MSIQKKSLISTLKTAKKANVASGNDADAKGSKVASMTARSLKVFKGTHFKSFKRAEAKRMAKNFG